MIVVCGFMIVRAFFLYLFLDSTLIRVLLLTFFPLSIY
jgi:hypothetical protein